MPSSSSNVGSGQYISVSDIFDPRILTNPEVTSPEFIQFLIKLTQRINDIARAVNTKDTGFYVLTEFVNSQVFFPNPALSSTTAQAPTPRQVFRKVYNTGALANAGTVTIAHGITIDASVTFTRIYGAASDTGASKEYIPLPFINVSGAVAAGSIELRADATNIYITTTGNGTNFNVSYIVLEYLKN